MKDGAIRNGGPVPYGAGETTTVRPNPNPGPGPGAGASEGTPTARPGNPQAYHQAQRETQAALGDGPPAPAPAGGGADVTQLPEVVRVNLHDNAVSRLLALCFCGDSVGLVNSWGAFNKAMSDIGGSAIDSSHMEAQAIRRFAVAPAPPPPRTPESAIDVSELDTSRIRAGEEREGPQRRYRMTVVGDRVRDGATQRRHDGVKGTDVDATWDGTARQFLINVGQVEQHSRARVQPLIDRTFHTALTSRSYAGENGQQAVRTLMVDGHVDAGRFQRQVLEPNIMRGADGQGRYFLTNRNFTPQQLVEIYDAQAEANPQIVAELTAMVESLPASTRNALIPPSMRNDPDAMKMAVAATMMMALNHNVAENNRRGQLVTDDASHFDFDEHDMARMDVSMEQADEVFIDRGVGLQSDVANQFEGFRTVERRDGPERVITPAGLAEDLSQTSQTMTVGSRSLDLGAPPETGTAGGDDDPLAAELDAAGASVDSADDVEHLQGSRQAVDEDLAATADALDRIDLSTLTPESRSTIENMNRLLKQLADSTLESAQTRTIRQELRSLLHRAIQSPQQEEVRGVAEQTLKRLDTQARLERIMAHVPEPLRPAPAPPPPPQPRPAQA